MSSFGLKGLDDTKTLPAKIRLLRLAVLVFRHREKPEVSALIQELPALGVKHGHPANDDSAEPVFQTIEYQVILRQATYVNPHDRPDLELELSTRFRRAGLSLDATPADHFSNHIEFLATLLSDGDDAAAVEFIHTGILPWIVPMAGAIYRAGDQLIKNVLEVVVELLTGADCLPPGASSRAEMSASVEHPVEGRTPRQLAAMLARPDVCGMYLGRSAIRELARSVDVATGFGDREGMFETLLSGAVRYDKLGELKQGFGAMFGREEVVYGQLGERNGMEVAASRWTGKLSAAKRVVGAFGEISSDERHR